MIKRDIDESVTRFKTRKIMKEYFKKYGIDFNQTFVAVIKPIVFRIIFTIIEFYNLDID